MNADNFEYRTAVTADVEALVPLINRAFDVELQFFTKERIDIADTIRHLETGTFLLAESGGRLGGCNYVELRGESGYFGLLSVDPGSKAAALGDTRRSG